MLELVIINRIPPDNPTILKKIFDEQGGVIGRDAHADWTLFDPTRIISSRHAKIVFSQENYLIMDISINGINTDQGVKLCKGQSRLLRLGDVYSIGSYKIKVAQLRIKNDESAFKNAGLDAILNVADSQRKELSPLQYVQEQTDFLNNKKALPHFPLQERHTLKAFNFMPEPYDFGHKNGIASAQPLAPEHTVIQIDERESEPPKDSVEYDKTGSTERLTKDELPDFFFNETFFKGAPAQASTQDEVVLADFIGKNVSHPVAVDHTSKSSDGFIEQFCHMFNLNSDEFIGLDDRLFKESITRLFEAMSKKWEK